MSDILKDKIEALTNQHDKSSKEDLIALIAKSEVKTEAAFATAEAANKTLTDQLARVNKDVEELNADLAKFENGEVKVLPKPTVKVGGKEYVIVVPKCNAKGKEFTAKQIKDNQETVVHVNKEMKIADFLVAIDSGVLTLKD